MNLLETLKEEIKTFEEKVDIYCEKKKWGRIEFSISAVIQKGRICYIRKSHDEETEEIKKNVPQES